MSFPSIDLALARRLERAEGLACAATVESRRVNQPDVGADSIDVDGTCAMFDGPASPMTQTFGLGLFDAFGARTLDRIEDFFTARGAATAHEVSAFAPTSTLSFFHQRGYVPIETSVILLCPTSASTDAETSGIRVRAIGEGEGALWARTSTRGWSSEAPEYAPFLEQLGGVIARTSGASCFLAELDGEPIAAATMHVQNGVALLAGASTIPEARGKGAQRALLRARLTFAADRGLDLAMIVTQPGSASQRNALRQGFRPVYTRVKWHRDLGGR